MGGRSLGRRLGRRPQNATRRYPASRAQEPARRPCPRLRDHPSTGRAQRRYLAPQRRVGLPDAAAAGGAGAGDLPRRRRQAGVRADRSGPSRDRAAGSGRHAVGERRGPRRPSCPAGHRGRSCSWRPARWPWPPTMPASSEPPASSRRPGKSSISCWLRTERSSRTAGQSGRSVQSVRLARRGGARPASPRRARPTPPARGRAIERSGVPRVNSR